MDARIGHKTQEHCTVYNMIRLADYLYRAEGGSEYQDYIEENLYNGVLAQCYYKGYADDYGHHSSFSNGFRSTVVTYFLPTAPGLKKFGVLKRNIFLLPWFCRTGLRYIPELCILQNGKRIYSQPIHQRLTGRW